MRRDSAASSLPATNESEAAHGQPRPTILVTGGTGQVGYELVRALAPWASVVAPGREMLDLADAASIRAVVRRVRPAAVVNAGAYTAVDRAESELESSTVINAIAPGVLAEEIARLGGALVHYSTDYVFDGTKTGAYVETDEPCPLNVYGDTKLAGERAIGAVGGPHMILRTSWVYGMRGHNFLRTMIRLSRERDELRVVCDQVGAPTWSRAIARVTSDVLRTLYAPGGDIAHAMGATTGIYHYTASGFTNWYEFARAIIERDQAGTGNARPRLVPITTAEYSTAARRPLNSRLSTAKLATLLGVDIPGWEAQLAAAFADA